MCPEHSTYLCRIKKGTPEITAKDNILDALQRLTTLARLYQHPEDFGYTRAAVTMFFNTAKMHVTKYYVETVAHAIEFFRRINDQGVKATDYEIFSGWLKTTLDGCTLIEDIDAAMCAADTVLMGAGRAERLKLSYVKRHGRSRKRNHKLFRTSLALFLTYVEDSADFCIMPPHAQRNQPEEQVEYKLAQWLKTVTSAEAEAKVEQFRRQICEAANNLRELQKTLAPEKKNHAWSVTATRAMLLVSLKFRWRDFVVFATWYIKTFRAQADWPSRAYLAAVENEAGRRELVAVPQTTVGALDWRLYGDDISAVSPLPLEFFYSRAEINARADRGRKKPILLDDMVWSHVIALNGGTPDDNAELYGVTVPENKTENRLRGNRDMSPSEQAAAKAELAAKAAAAERERQLGLLVHEGAAKKSV